MSKKINKVFQFKVTLEGSKPLIWRRIQVPASYTFWDFHVAIQDSMGWLDYHLHSFFILNPKMGKKVEIGIPDEDDRNMGRTIFEGWKENIADYFSEDNLQAKYVYDFGDDWNHLIKLEKTTDSLPEEKYPRCLGGARACPPEDCEGMHGFYELLKILKNPKHEEYDEMIEWLGGKYNPEEFDAETINFDDPKERFKTAFS